MYGIAVAETPEASVVRIYEKLGPYEGEIAVKRDILSEVKRYTKSHEPRAFSGQLSFYYKTDMEHADLTATGRLLRLGSHTAIDRQASLDRRRKNAEAVAASLRTFEGTQKPIIKYQNDNDCDFETAVQAMGLMETPEKEATG